MCWLKQPGTGTLEPMTRRAEPTARKKSSANSRRSFYNATRGSETRGEERNTVLGQQVCPGQVERDHQYRPEGKLSQSEAEARVRAQDH